MSLTTPVRMRLSRARGFRLQAASRAINGLPAVNCARPGPYGNPYRILQPMDMRLAYRWWGFEVGMRDAVPRDAVEAVAMFRASVLLSTSALATMDSLRGHNLACWCRECEPCHVDVDVDVELELANR